MIRISEWVIVSSNTGSPGSSWTKCRKIAILVVVIVVFQQVG